jgi:two-component system, OmpR family, response regulator
MEATMTTMTTMAQPASPRAERRARILVVDHDPHTVDLLSACLRFQDFEVTTASDGSTALDQARTARPDAVIIDVVLPDMPGLRVLRQLRVEGITAPVLLLGAGTTIEDRVTGLTMGADDYVTTPFSLEELVMRLRVILRRTGLTSSVRGTGPLTFADIELDEDSHQVFKAGTPVWLSAKEFALLHYLITNAGAVVTRRQIIAHVWRGDVQRDDRVVESYICKLRRKIDSDDDQRLIHTLRGIGYILRQRTDASTRRPS